MCGICGIVSIDGAPLTPAALGPMLKSLAHRGPDGEGTWCEGIAALGHRRLAIIDIQGGAQPMTNESGSVIVTFNGEIYNHREISDRLKAKGHVFKTRCDTEALVHLWEEEGTNMLSSIRGMFAFAIWDSKSRSLFCARDRLGEKPFYYCFLDGRFVFSSEIKGLLALGQNRFSINREAIDSYFAVLHTAGEQTAIRQIKRLPQGHSLLLKNGALTIKSYWVPPIGRHEQRPIKQWHEMIAQAVDRAASYQVESDVPLGVFLSGGWDSSTVAAAVSRHIEGTVRTFSIGFGRPDDETRFARAMAGRINATHTELASGLTLEEILLQLQRIYDEPFADSAAVPMIELCRAASQHLKVVIGGDGGDEIFGGYPRYLDVRRLLRRPRNIKEMLWKSANSPRWRTAKHPLISRILYPAGPEHSVLFNNPYLYIFGQPFIGAQARKKLLDFSQKPSEPTPHEQLLLSRFDKIEPHFDDYDLCALYDLNVYLPDDLLVKVDIASMSCGLELRSPLLDHELVELSLSVPSEVRMPGDLLKGLFRQAVGDWLADEVRNRQDKKGLGAPIEAWVARPEVQHRISDLVLSGSSPLQGLIDLDFARKICRKSVKSDYRQSYLAWQLMCLALWRIAYPGVCIDRPETGSRT